jgi:hypothetical protein
VKKCDVCRAREQRELEQALEEERLAGLWLPRECASPECDEVFTPAAAQQRFCSDACRKRTHRRAKAGLAPAMP